MTAEVRNFILVLVVNTLVVAAYVIWNVVQKREEKTYRIKAAVMLMCPVIGPLFFLLAQIFLKLLFAQQVDLEDVIFSKDRVKTYLHADEERERNMVPLEEAIAISDKDSLRNLMLSVVKGDIRKSLAAISLAMNSEDSETAHYAASVLQDALNDFRTRVQKLYREIQKGGNHQTEYAVMLAEYMNQVLSQQVFSDTEQRAMVNILEDICRILYEKDRQRLTAEYYEAVCLRLLGIRDFERCEIWCERGMEQFPDALSSYTCKLKLFFTSGAREKFFKTLDMLKKSDVIIDKETLELIRTFS